MSDGRLRRAPVLLALGLSGLVCLFALSLAPPSTAMAASSSGKATTGKDTAGKDTNGKDSKEIDTKGPKTKDTKDKPINVEADKLDYYDKEQKLVYRGNVVAIQGEVTLKTPMLVVYLTPKEADAPKGPPASQSQVRRWEASGPVTLISKDQIGTGDAGTYEKAENKFYLNGNVTLTQNDYITKGDHAVYDLETGRSVVTGHVRSMFPPKNKEDETAKKDDKPNRTSSKLDTKPKPQ